MSTPTTDQRLRALCVKMKIDADARLFEQGHVEFDVITAIEESVDRQERALKGIREYADAEKRGREYAEQRCAIAEDRATAAEGKLTAIRSALGIPEPKP